MRKIAAALTVSILSLTGLLPVAPVTAATAPTAVATSDITKVEAYFQNLKTAQSRFQQTSSDGTRLNGVFYLSRPGKLRFEYDPPNRDFIVADGIFIYFYDSQLKQQTNAPISQTLADFLLRQNLKLGKDLKVVESGREKNLLRMKVIQTAQPNAGSLTLYFSEAPKLELRKWQVRDASGAVTEIVLSDIKTGGALPKSLFVYRDPQRKGLNQ